MRKDGPDVARPDFSGDARGQERRMKSHCHPDAQTEDRLDNLDCAQALLIRDGRRGDAAAISPIYETYCKSK